MKQHLIKCLKIANLDLFIYIVKLIVNQVYHLLSNKTNITLQSLSDSVNFISNKFDDFNNTFSKLRNEMKGLR